MKNIASAAQYIFPLSNKIQTMRVITKTCRHFWRRCSDKKLTCMTIKEMVIYNSASFGVAVIKWYRTIDEKVMTPRMLTKVISCSSISGPDIFTLQELRTEHFRMTPISRDSSGWQRAESRGRNEKTEECYVSG